MTRSLIRIVVLGASLLAGCPFRPDCPDPGPAPNLERSYIERDWAGVSPPDAATLDVRADDAVLEYTAPDGTRWRARYAIASRSTDP